MFFYILHVSVWHVALLCDQIWISTGQAALDCFREV